jgi:two-component system chemotaxis response regulator CheB
MLISGDHIRLVRGPRENWARPAIDPLFRSAAVAHRSRVIGVILSGWMDDGAAGLAAIKRCGGIAIVQHPADATSPDMPQNALKNLEPDYCLPSQQIGALLNELAHQPAPSPAAVPEDLALEVRLTESTDITIDKEYNLGDPSPYVCPECGGALWQIEDNETLRYRCHVGHAFGIHCLLEGQRESLEKAMWTAARIIEQHIRLLDRMAAESEERGRYRLAKDYRGRKAELDEQANQIRQFLLSQREAATSPSAEAIPLAESG